MINDSTNIKTLEYKISELLDLLNEIDLSLDSYAGSEEIAVINTKYQYFLNNYFDWIKENVEVSHNNKIYNYYNNKYFSNNNYYNTTMDHLNEFIQKSFIHLFNRCLDNYLLENDEPIWVDKNDSLYVIKWTLENQFFSKNIDNCKYFSSYDDDFNFQDQNILNNSIDFVSCYDLQQKHLNDNILKNIYNKVYSSNADYYLTSYDINVISNFYNYSINNSYFDKNDSDYEILFYLNLYHSFKEVYYQEVYLNSDKSVTYIKNDISKNCFLNNEDRKSLFYEHIFSTSYYKLNEFIINQALNNKFNNVVLNGNILDDLIESIISNNKNK